MLKTQYQLVFVNSIGSKGLHTCAVEFDVFINFRFNCRCDRNLLRTDTDELASVEKSLWCSLIITTQQTFSLFTIN